MAQEHRTSLQTPLIAQYRSGINRDTHTHTRNMLSAWITFRAPAQSGRKWWTSGRQILM